MSPAPGTPAGSPPAKAGLVGQPLSRTDGHAKVTGTAVYAAEHPLAGLTHAVLVTSTVPNGRISALFTARAERMRGVLLVMTHLNAPRLAEGGQAGVNPPAGRILSLLQDGQVHYNNQPVALVVADTLEHAQDAARVVRITYAESPAQRDFARAKGAARKTRMLRGAPADTQRGDFQAGWSAARSRVEAVYTTPVENHNPMEPHAIVANWEGGRLTLYDTTQNVSGVQATVALRFGMDPIALRLRNEPDRDPGSGLPWSSRSLRQCFAAGAERFGWAGRDPAPRSMRNGTLLAGWGVAAATYPAHRSPANAAATVFGDGTALVQSGTHDLGTGTYTVMAQIAADALGLPLEKVRFELGDTLLPQAPGSGGSQSVASVAPAVQAAARAAREQLVALAVGDPRSPVHGSSPEAVALEGGWLFRKADPRDREAVSVLLARHGGGPVRAVRESRPGEEAHAYSMHSYGAVFAEVNVDPDLGIITVPRIVAAYGVGNLMNRKTGRSQLMGGIIWGLGMALMEKTEMDPRTGRAANGNLADYHVPVNADVGSIDIIVVDETDPYINALGAKGIGEIGIVGVAAAIANAVCHATGKRIRDLPITLDKLL